MSKEILFTLENRLSDWEKVVKQIFPLLNKPLLLLNGNLGAGKTTFTQFLLKKMQSKDEVQSPTYSIVNEYITEKGRIFHFDLYRIKSIEEAYDVNIEEYLEQGVLSIIEWPDIYLPYFQNEAYHQLDIFFDVETQKRHLKFIP